MFDAYTDTYNDLCNIIFYFRKLQAPHSSLVCGATCGMDVFAGFVDKFFGHFRPEIRYRALPHGSQNVYKMLPIYSSSIWHKAFDPPGWKPATIWRNPRAKHSPVYCSESGPRPRHSSPSYKEEITPQETNIIRIPSAFACISAGAPWIWCSVMQIDQVSQEPARLRMLTAPFHGTLFPLEVYNAWRAWLQYQPVALA